MLPFGPRARRGALRPLVALGLVALLAPSAARGADLVRGVRFKLSAGDLASAEAAVEDYRLKAGVDPEYLDAVGWLARGAEMIRRLDAAAAWITELRREIREEKPELVTPLGAAIEVEGKLRAFREGRGSAIRFLEYELGRASAVALRSRIRKNLNLLTLEGQPAPELGSLDPAGPGTPRLAGLLGKPVLLFFWAHWCGDCKAQAPALDRILRKYGPQGLTLVAPTRLYGTGAEGKPATPSEEKVQLAKIWGESYSGLDGVAVPIDTETMVRYGASATPTLVLVDRKGLVRLYTPTRMSEAELSRRIEEVLAETP
jgi:thiol-disulfide isomerase/thioredoxin